MPDNSVEIETPEVPSKRFVVNKRVLAGAAAAVLGVAAFYVIDKFTREANEPLESDSPFVS